MIDLLFKVVVFLFKLLILALTGEWPGGEDDKPAAAPQTRPSAKARSPKPWPAAQAKVDVAALARAQRAVEPLRRVLADVDTVLSALAEPLVTHARNETLTLPSLTFVAVANLKGPQAPQPGSDTTLVPVSVNDNFADMPERWVFLARDVGRTMLDSLGGFARELEGTHRLAPSLFLPPEDGAYDADSARAALGVWFPELFSDVYATYVLGPAYAAQLLRSLSRPKQPVDTLVARSQGRFLALAPPAVMRVQAVLFVLTQLGFHAFQQKLADRWKKAHPDQNTLYLPLAAGSLMDVPLGFMVSELAAILKGLLEDPQAALGGQTFLDIPGLAFLHAEQSQAELVAGSLLRGQPVDAEPRVLIAAAALALDGGMRARSEVAAALARSLRGKDTLESAPSAYDAKPAAAPQRTTLKAAFRDRKAVREALVIGAALTPIKRRSSRS